MAYEEKVIPISLNANADLSSSSKKFVKGVNASGETRIALAAAGEDALGVLTDAPKAGHPGRVAIGGIAPVIAGGAINAGAFVASDATGKAVTYASGAKMGIAMETASGDGHVIAVLIQPRG